MAEQIKGVEAGVMGIGPRKPQRVCAHPAHAHGTDRGRDVLRRQTRRPVAELPLASRAWAVDPQILPRIVRPMAVGPRDRQLLVCDAADLDRSRHLRLYVNTSVTQQRHYGRAERARGPTAHSIIRSRILVQVPTPDSSLGVGPPEGTASPHLADAGGGAYVA